MIVRYSGPKEPRAFKKGRGLLKAKTTSCFLCLAFVGGSFVLAGSLTEAKTSS